MKLTMMMAVTADGKIAKSDDHFPDWTSTEDKKLFAKISKEHKAVIFGDKTFFTLPGPLPNRLNVVFTLDENPPVKEGVKWIIKGDPVKVLEELEKEGYDTALLGGGAFINSLFLEHKLIDEIILTYEPLLFGAGLSIFSKDTDTKLKLLELDKINEDAFMARYKVLY